MSHQKVLGPEEARRVRQAYRESGKRVVQCHGCFDIVHPGHLRYLKFAREQGDILIVSVSGDDVVGKGYDRPYINETLRVENLAALECVDHVVLDTHDWAGPILEVLRPDVYVKGKEYETKSDPRFAKEKELVERNGGSVIFSSGDVVYSSTAILGLYRERFGLENEKIAFFCRRHGVDHDAIQQALKKCAGKRVLVLGDPILDKYVQCDAAKIAAEGPILSVKPVTEDLYVGGAGLIAAQMAALGAEVTFLTCAGRGSLIDSLREQVEESGVTLRRVIAEGRDVFLKTRYIVDEKKVLKVDEGRYGPPSSTAVDELIRMLKGLIPAHDALVVTDFGYGLFSPTLMRAINHITSRTGRPFYADVSTSGRANIMKFHGTRLATPTETELRFAMADNESGLAPLAARYYKETGARRLIITLGKRGALFFHPPDSDAPARLRTDYLPALQAEKKDAVGAGDVFLATLALSDMAGVPIQTGMYLASAVASIHVGRLGNDPVDGLLLRRFLALRPELGAGA